MRKTISTKVVYENKYFRVSEDRFIHPHDEEEGSYAYVEKSTAVVVVALDEADRIFFVKQYRYTVDAESVELPIGKVEGNEPPLEGAKRELLEETGLSASSWNLLGVLWEVPGWSSSSAYVYLARGLSRSSRRLEHTERDMTDTTISLAEVRGMIAAGEIRDCLTISSLCLHMMQG